MTENRKSQASAKYDAENTKRVYLKLNKGTDADIIGWLSLKINTQGYIKSLIREDMDMNKKRIQRCDYWLNKGPGHRDRTDGNR